MIKLKLFYVKFDKSKKHRYATKENVMQQTGFYSMYNKPPNKPQHGCKREKRY